MRRSHLLAALMRPANTRASLLLLVGGSIVLGAPRAQIVLCAMLVVVLYGVATIGNDLRDQDTDRANNRPTPLTAGAVTGAQAVMVGAALLAVAAGAQPWLPQPAGALFTLTYLALAAAYSAPRLALEDRGLGATVVLATCYFVLPLALAVRLGGSPPHARLALLLPAAALLAGAGLLYKDFKDEVGDRRFGKRTPLVRYGARAVVAMSGALACAGAALGLAASHHRLLTAALLGGAGAPWARTAIRPGQSPGAVQLYYLLAAGALLASL